MSRLCGTNPAISLSILPFALPLGLILQIVENARPVLKIIFPVANVPVSVGKVLCTFSVHFAGQEVTFVSRLIGPDQNSFAFHVIIFEFTFIQFARIGKVILTVSMKLAIYKIAFIVSSLEFKPAVS